MGTVGPFPGGKARPMRDADHWPPSSAEVKNEQELCFLVACIEVAGQLYIFTLIALKVFQVLTATSMKEAVVWDVTKHPMGQARL
jgi:hypothetical protein